MKTLFIFTLALLVNTLAFANPAYEKAMKQQIEALEAASTQAEYLAVANAFERIAQKETTEWLPLYYASYSYLNVGSVDRSMSLDEKDKYFAKASEIADKAAEIREDHSEITALKGYITMAKLSADAANRGQSLSPLAMQLFNQSIAQNPENPRALYLLGRMQYGMAQFFGQGTEDACKLVKQSVALFEAQPDEETIYPSWGEASAKAMIKNCQ